MMNELIENYLRGIRLEENDQQIWKNKPKGILNIFVSSTFTDTHTERNILHEEILPKLIEKGFENEIQITLYDMRFGVKDENTIDHMTWEICREGIQQCYEESDGLFFLSLQSDKYGYCPLPKYLSKDLIDIWLTKASSESGFDLFHEWYQVDTNSTPASYILKNLTDANTNLFYEIVLPSLRDGCLDSFPFTNLSSNELFLSRSPSQNDGQQLLVNRSVTEWETLFAMNLDAKKCCWIHRDFPSSSLKEFSSDISLSKDLKLFEFCDYQGIPSKEEKINLLKTQMKRRITDALTLPIYVRSYIEGVRKLAEKDARDEYDHYIDQWRITTLHRLNQEIHKLIQRRTEWKSQFYRGLSVPLPQQYLEEFLHHNHNAMKKVKNFFGRSNLLQQAIVSIIGWTSKNQLPTEQPDSNSQMIEISESDSDSSFSLSSDSRHKTPGNNEQANNLQSSVALALVGQSGTGKTALLAKLFTSVMQHLDYFIPTIIRFCGTSQYSMTGTSLIQSISIQIMLVYRNYDLLTNFMMRLSSLTYDQSIREIHQLLEEYPIYLFIDSLDSLSNKNEARSRLRFLLHIPKLNPHSRIIVSTLPDPPTGKIFYQCETRLRETNTPILLVNSLDHSEIIETYQQLLAKQSRGLTAAHWDTVMTATLVEPTILYLNLAIEIVRKWRSFDDPTDLSLSSTVKGIIHQIFSKMERDYGRQLVSWAFAFITFSRDGMNDQEIRDCLAKQSLVCQEVFQYSQMGQHAFPMHVWLRVKLAIRSLLFEQQEGHGTRWYHRQLWETAEERYNSLRIESHSILAHYFQAYRYH